MKKVLILLCLCLLNGCGLAFQSNAKRLLENATLADFGEKPPENHWQITEEMLSQSLIDPESARFTNYHDPFTCAFPEKAFSPTPILGWCTKISVNAKNRFGGYVGARPYEIHWKDGRIYNYQEIIQFGGR